MFLRLALLLPSPSAASAHSLRSVSHSFSVISLPSILPFLRLTPDLSFSCYTHIAVCSFSSQASAISLAFSFIVMCLFFFTPVCYLFKSFSHQTAITCRRRRPSWVIRGGIQFVVFPMLLTKYFTTWKNSRWACEMHRFIVLGLIKKMIFVYKNTETQLAFLLIFLVEFKHI